MPWITRIKLSLQRVLHWVGIIPFVWYYTRAGLTNIRFLQAELSQGKFSLDGFDRIVLVSVLGEIPHQAAALGELYAVLKPGGDRTVLI